MKKKIEIERIQGEKPRNLKNLGLVVTIKLILKLAIREMLVKVKEACKSLNSLL